MMIFPPKIRAFVDCQSWTFARTYAETWPHEYLVRDQVDDQLFVQLVNHIREYGYKAWFYDRQFTYFNEAGMAYWTMGALVEETTIVNRCTKEQTYEYRQNNGLLPVKENTSKRGQANCNF
jgi:hypothetical protein